MPIYEYRCLDCGEMSEVFIRSPDSEGVTCPNCGSKNLEKLLPSSYAIRMGGSAPGKTCCGRSQRCEVPPCSTGDVCRRD